MTRFMVLLLLRLCARLTGAREHPFAVGGRDRRLADVERIFPLRADALDRDFLADLQRVLAPSLAEQRVRRTTLDAIDNRLAVGGLGLDRRVDMRIRPVDLLDRSLEFDRLSCVELRRNGMMRP